MSGVLHSAVYEGVVHHHRHHPRVHAFGYRMAQLYLDLDEVDAVFRDRWLWSVEKPNLASFRREDFLGDPAVPLAQAVRERVPELATLKTLGFKDGTVLMLVMIESVLLVGLGGLLGMVLASLVLPVVAANFGGVLPAHVPWNTWLLGVALVLLIGTIVGLLPALRAKRLKIVDALAGR